MSEDDFAGFFTRSLSSTWADPAKIPSIDQTARNLWNDLRLAGYRIEKIRDDEDLH